MSVTSTAWGTGTEELQGLDLVDKAELVGKPFMITAVWFEQNQRDVDYVYVEGVHTGGDTFCFNDSSKGVKVQIEQYLSNKGIAPKPLGEVHEGLKLVIPRGLRVSQFTVLDERGREKQAKTYYLTTNGKRAGTSSTTATSQPPAKRVVAKQR